MDLLTKIFDFFLPRFCASCKVILPSSAKIICADCVEKLRSPDERQLYAEFSRKFEKDKIISSFFSGFVYDAVNPIHDLIHELKYNRRFSYGIYIGTLVGKLVENRKEFENADLIIPVPIHSIKKVERGYNQSLYISKGISKILDVPISKRALKRKIYTESQTKLNTQERRSNISKAFKVKSKKIIEGKKIILIDDVITTGATMSECARELKQNGADTIVAVSAAIADFNLTSFPAQSTQELKDHS